MNPRIALVAGEQSGDILGAGLISELRKHWPQAHFFGIGGPRMQALGFQTLAPIEALSVMGLIEPIKHLPELLSLRRHLRQYLLKNPPAVFIGIDAPDFNLGLECQLRRASILTVHYVSPSVWAWRQWRIKKIARSVDLMLTLYPFEERFYQQSGIPVHCVGHPLADEIPLRTDRLAACQTLGLTTQPEPLLAILPGSRFSEVERLAPLFLQTAGWIVEQRKDMRFILPAATPALAQHLQALIQQQAAGLKINLIDGEARAAMAAADAVLLTSGTATLEALLLKRPMVVAYQTAPITAWLARRLVKAPYFSLPNLLASERLVPEFFQEQATVETLGKAMLALLDEKNHMENLQQRFMELHQELRCNASEQAALAIQKLLKANC